VAASDRRLAAASDRLGAAADGKPQATYVQQPWPITINNALSNYFRLYYF